MLFILYLLIRHFRNQLNTRDPADGFYQYLKIIG